MKVININLLETSLCSRPLASERKLAPFFGSVAVQLKLEDGSHIEFKMIDLNDDYVAKSFSAVDCYEPLAITNWIEISKTVKGSILDIGASTGLYSLLASKANRHVAVHAFEPFSRAVSRLVNNKELNSLPKIRIHPFAVGPDTSVAEFSIRNFEGPITTGGSLVGTQDNVTSCLVSVKPIQSVLGETERVELMKIDVEGYELGVLTSMKELIGRDQPTIFFESNNITHYQDMITFFSAISYSVECVDEKNHQLLQVTGETQSLAGNNFIARITKKP